VIPLATMAEPNSAAAPALNTNIESGNFDEKVAHRDNEPVPTHKPKIEEDEEEDEDIDALIEDLESQDGGNDAEEEEENQGVGSGRTIPEEMLQTDTRLGLTEGMCVAAWRWTSHYHDFV
jgi:H+-transporting ATPase